MSFVLLQAQIAANDGLVDGPGSNSEESQLMGCCFHLLLQAISALLSWWGLVMYSINIWAPFY